jgi:hypothetical protein
MTSDNSPIWFRLIYYLKQEGIYEFGPTIPYIIGAYQIYGKTLIPKENAIKLLFDEMLNAQLGHCAVIHKCPDIKQFVIGIQEKEICNLYYGKEILFENNQGEKTLFTTPNAKELGGSLEGAILNLEASLYEPLEMSKYSWDRLNKEWKHFDESDEKLIRKAIS